MPQPQSLSGPSSNMMAKTNSCPCPLLPLTRRGELKLRWFASSLSKGSRLCPTYGCPGDLDDKEVNSYQTKSESAFPRGHQHSHTWALLPVRHQDAEGHTFHHILEMTKIKAARPPVNGCLGDGQWRVGKDCPFRPESKPSRLLGFPFVLSIPLSNVCVVHLCVMTIIYNRKRKTL